MKKGLTKFIAFSMILAITAGLTACSTSDTSTSNNNTNASQTNTQDSEGADDDTAFISWHFNEIDWSKYEKKTDLKGTNIFWGKEDEMTFPLDIREYDKLFSQYIVDYYFIDGIKYDPNTRNVYFDTFEEVLSQTISQTRLDNWENAVTSTYYLTFPFNGTASWKEGWKDAIVDMHLCKFDDSIKIIGDAYEKAWWYLEIYTSPIMKSEKVQDIDAQFEMLGLPSGICCYETDQYNMLINNTNVSATEINQDDYNYIQINYSYIYDFGDYVIETPLINESRLEENGYQTVDFVSGHYDSYYYPKECFEALIANGDHAPYYALDLK